MDLQLVYKQLNGNYNEVMSRLMKEERVFKYLKKFTANSDYADFCRGYEAHDWELAFRAVHSIKGMALNLAITELAEVSSELCETMREGEPQVDITKLVADFKVEYDLVMGVLNTL